MAVRKTSSGWAVYVNGVPMSCTMKTRELARRAEKSLKIHLAGPEHARACQAYEKTQGMMG